MSLLAQLEDALVDACEAVNHSVEKLETKLTFENVGLALWRTAKIYADTAEATVQLAQDFLGPSAESPLPRGSSENLPNAQSPFPHRSSTATVEAPTASSRGFRGNHPSRACCLSATSLENVRDPVSSELRGNDSAPMAPPTRLPGNHRSRSASATRWEKLIPSRCAVQGNTGESDKWNPGVPVLESGTPAAPVESSSGAYGRPTSPLGAEVSSQLRYPLPSSVGSAVSSKALETSFVCTVPPRRAKTSKGKATDGLDKALTLIAQPKETGSNWFDPEPRLRPQGIQWKQVGQNEDPDLPSIQKWLQEVR